MRMLYNQIIEFENMDTTTKSSAASEAARLMANERWAKEEPDLERLRKIAAKGGRKNRGKKRKKRNLKKV